MNRERRYTGSCGNENRKYEHEEEERENEIPRGVLGRTVTVGRPARLRIKHRSCPCAAFGARAAITSVRPSWVAEGHRLITGVVGVRRSVMCDTGA